MCVLPLSQKAGSMLVRFWKAQCILNLRNLHQILVVLAYVKDNLTWKLRRNKINHSVFKKLIFLMFPTDAKLLDKFDSCIHYHRCSHNFLLKLECENTCGNMKKIIQNTATWRWLNYYHPGKYQNRTKFIRL